MDFNRNQFIRGLFATIPCCFYWNDPLRLVIGLFVSLFFFFATLSVYGLFRTFFPNKLMELSLILWLAMWALVVTSLSGLEPYWAVSVFLLLPRRAVPDPAAKNFFLEMITQAIVYSGIGSLLAMIFKILFHDQFFTDIQMDLFFIIVGSIPLFSFNEYEMKKKITATKRIGKYAVESAEIALGLFLLTTTFQFAKPILAGWEAMAVILLGHALAWINKRSRAYQAVFFLSGYVFLNLLKQVTYPMQLFYLFSTAALIFVSRAGILHLDLRTLLSNVPSVIQGAVKKFIFCVFVWVWGYFAVQALPFMF